MVAAARGLERSYRVAEGGGDVWTRGGPADQQTGLLVGDVVDLEVLGGREFVDEGADRADVAGGMGGLLGRVDDAHGEDVLSAKGQVADFDVEIFGSQFRL